MQAGRNVVLVAINASKQKKPYSSVSKGLPSSPRLAIRTSHIDVVTPPEQAVSDVHPGDGLVIADPSVSRTTMA